MSCAAGRSMPAVIGPTPDIVFGIAGIDDVWCILREGRQRLQQHAALARVGTVTRSLRSLQSRRWF
jgi:hypothetical protein